MAERTPDAAITTTRKPTATRKPTNLDVDSPWLRLQHEGAAYARQGGRALRKAVKDGKLRAARVGGRGELLTTRAWIDDYLETLAAPVEVLPIRRRMS